ncbi:MAG: NUDIX hydrolase [Streptosporangiaceae bacterium]
MTTPALREAARAILLDPDDRVMLLRYDENGGFWATPGGSLEPGETPRQAVIRELREELGVSHVDLGPHLATRTKDHQVAGRDVRQAEQYYLARVRPENVDPQSAANPDNIQEWRWWSLAELTATSQTVYPAELTELLRGILASGPPPAPLTLK